MKRFKKEMRSESLSMVFLKKIMLLLFSIGMLSETKALNLSDPQNTSKEIDSLLSVVKIASPDSFKVKSLNKLSRHYINISDFDNAMKYALDSKILSEKLGFKPGIAATYNIIGSIYGEQGEITKALENDFKALHISEENNFKSNAALSYTLIGSAYLGSGQNKIALENYKRSLEIRSVINDTEGMAACYNNIGIIYKNLKDDDEALKNYEKCLDLMEELYAKFKKKEYLRAVASVENNIGLIYFNKEKYNEALKMQMKSLKLKEQLDFKLGIATSCDNIGMVYTKLHKFDEAYKYFTRALEINKSIGAKIRIKECYEDMANLYIEKGDYKTALEYRKLFAAIKDSVLNEDSGKQIAEMNIKYDSEKKDKELVQKEAELKSQMVEADKKDLIRNALAIGFAFILIGAFIILKNYRQKRKANGLLVEKNELIEQQKKIVEQKNDKITDSISYAKKIQQATLPLEELIEQRFSHAFVLFLPRDIVSGDFYWYSENDLNDEHVQILVVADCTGHGVPGAFMSMIGNTQLNEIINVKKNYNPAEILNELNSSIINLLNQNRDDINSQEDGMDMSILVIRKSKNNPGKIKMKYSCANHSVYLLNQKEIKILKGDIYSVGGMFRGANVEFHEYELDIKPGTRLYLYTDGYVDQFGGEKNSKFTTQKFEELILSSQNKTLREQKDLFFRSIQNWKGSNNQLDDILLLGVEL